MRKSATTSLPSLSVRIDLDEVGRMLADTLANARSLKARMAERIVNQDAALETICRRIQTFERLRDRPW